MSAIDKRDKLSASEAETLRKHEEVIERGMETFIEVGTALTAIREGRLYREKASSFDDYCRAFWGMSRVHAHRLIEAAGVVEDLLPIGNAVPATESQARPLARIKGPEQRREVWRNAVDAAPAGKVTAARVEAAVKEHTGKGEGTAGSRPEVKVRAGDRGKFWKDMDLFRDSIKRRNMIVGLFEELSVQDALAAVLTFEAIRDAAAGCLAEFEEHMAEHSGIN